MHITNSELFKLAAINTPKSKLLPLMPVDMQSASIDQNRMKSKYITLMMATWKSYSKNVTGHTCPVFGTFTEYNQILPSKDLSDICEVEHTVNQSEIDKYPTLDLALVAREAGWGTHDTVLQVLKLILLTMKYIFNKKWFQTIKL